ncbi:transmembrane protein 263 [Elysia marginata]|uniref:Transmembrane protein 263 n=1 Tax=Elysia marginata TaxID=1093978 RepID=A0AAV4HAW9_9GAST|nr:transmembrane protein 263 [Elysia marginata]
MASEGETYSSSSDKKTDVSKEEPTAQGGFLWRMSAGLYNTTTGVVTGAVGYSVDGVKWVAGKTVDVGSAVAHKTIDASSAVTSKLPLPSIPFVSKKDKKE